MIYVTKNFSTFGKEFPSMGPVRFQRVPGRAGTLVRGAEFAYRYISRHRNALTAISSLAIGAGISSGGLEVNEGAHTFDKTLRPVHRVLNRKLDCNRAGTRSQCTCRRQKRSSRGRRRNAN